MCFEKVKVFSDVAVQGFYQGNSEKLWTTILHLLLGLGRGECSMTISLMPSIKSDCPL